MPVYTVHAPVGSNTDIRATDRFAFVRDGFHVWAAILGVVWLAWHRLWLALIGWIVLMTVIDVALVRFGLSGVAIFAVDGLLALLLGFEAASLQRWTLSRRKWRQLDIVVADDEEADTGRHRRHAGGVEIDHNLDVGFPGGALDRCLAHGQNPFRLGSRAFYQGFARFASAAWRHH